MRGTFHEKLRGLLDRAVNTDKVCTQESLAAAMDADQTTIGKYLRNKAGALDLDEAEIALRHIGSSLNLFVATNGVVTPRADFDVLVSRLMRNQDFRAMVITLAAATVARQRSALRRLAELAPALAPPKRAGRSAGSGRKAGSTTKAKGLRR